MNKIEYIEVAGKRYVIIPYTLLDSFSRTYDNFSSFARSKGFKEILEEDERSTKWWPVVVSLRARYPHILRIAIGYFPQFIDEKEYRYRLVIFPDSNPDSKPEMEADISDMVHDEPEFENAVCVFRA